MLHSIVKHVIVNLVGITAHYTHIGKPDILQIDETLLGIALGIALLAVNNQTYRIAHSQRVEAVEVRAAANVHGRLEFAQT